MCHKLLGGDGGSLVAGPLIVFVAAQLVPTHRCIYGFPQVESRPQLTVLPFGQGPSVESSAEGDWPARDARIQGIQGCCGPEIVDY
ncbi:hypothetical protein E4U54_000233 [Claviceps lovelessii]|nr:hypothetical protein E4U54_000233 [Claviceps lovelessii]